MGINLWVDDLRNPESFRPGEAWVWVKTITEAIRLLATAPVDLVALDHDIMLADGDVAGMDKIVISKGYSLETFEPVAHYIALMPRPPKVEFHTSNYAGQKCMEKILADGQRRREFEADKVVLAGCVVKGRHVLRLPPED